MVDNNSQIRMTSKKLGTDFKSNSNEDLPLFDRLRQSLSLPPLPPVASQIMKMCRNQDTEVEKLAEVISQDPAVVARLLQIANSSYYGGARHKVTSIVQAVTLLGMDAVGSLALSFCFYRLCRDMDHPERSGMDHVKFWRRSIIASIAGRALGQWKKVGDPELVFLAALLQDIGLLALNGVEPEVMRTLTMNAKDDHTQLQIFETEHFGCDHAKVGSWVAESWQLPEEFQTAIANSHHPGDRDDYQEEQRKIVRCVALSGRLADIWCRSDTEKVVHDATTAAKDLLDLNPEDLQTILTKIPEGLSEIASFFQVHIGNAEEINRPLQTATKILLSDSINDTSQEDT